MLRLLAVLLRASVSALRSRAALAVENLALRQQLATLVNSGERPRIRPADRAFWLVLHRLWSRWAEVLVIVKPATVIRWHRAGFRLYWRWLSRPRRAGRPPTTRELRDLIGRMALDNNWGAPRVHGELLRLGFQVSERTVSRFLRGLHRFPARRQSWLTFLRNHRDGIAAMDLFTVPTVTFRVLYVWFVIRHRRREIAHFHITDHPTSAWVVQQLREAFPYDTAPRYLVFDRDSSFSAQVVATTKSMGAKPKRTAYRSPWQNGVAERWIGSVRRELLDHVIVLSEQHLHGLLRQYVRYYHEDRTHLGLGKDAPAGRAVEPRPCAAAQVVTRPRIGGLHHRYQWRAAA